MADAGGGDPEREAPVRHLLDRTREGVAVLVTGAVPAAVHRSMSARLLGSPGTDRRRVLALTHHDEGGVADRLPAGASTAPDRLRAVFGDGWTRSTPADDASTLSHDADLTLPTESVTTLGDPSLSTFGDRIARAVGGLDRLAGGFEPGQLRLCLDSLDHLADDYDGETVLRFAHLVADQVRGHDGVAHFHTRRAVDDPPVPGVDDVTEVVIRLRLAGDVPEFRPSLDGETLTDWRRLPSTPE